LPTACCSLALNALCTALVLDCEGMSATEDSKADEA
jgi:hypothetical protein